MENPNVKLETKQNEILIYDLNSLISNGKNSRSVVCERCGSVILKPLVAVYMKIPMDLPIMHKKTAEEPDSTMERVQDCWLIDNMYTFENVGFSHTVGTTKFLTCADCEIGPIGWHDIEKKTEYYIALSRVKHVNENTTKD